MSEIIIENIIASTTIEEEIDLEELSQELDATLNYETDEEGNETPLSILYENEDDIALCLFNDGRLVSIKATTIEDAEQSINQFIDLLNF